MIGGCLCGAVRYRLASAPTDVGYCHCRNCQLNSGAPAMVFGSVAVANWIVEQGANALRVHTSSEFGRRTFCGQCGTPLHFHDVRDTTLDLSIATLDQPGDHAPGYHIFTSSKIGWFDTADQLPRHERARPKPA